LIARLVHLQVVQHDYYTTRAEDNRISLVPIVPNRGVIVDRHGTVLARNYSAFTLEITPSKVADLDATIEGLGKLIEVLPKDRKRFRKLLEESKNFESLPIRTRLTEEEVARFAANRYLFPGVEVKARLFRQYPLGPIASHAIGYINRINKRDLELIEESEKARTTRVPTTSARPGSSRSTNFNCMAKPATSRSRSTLAAGRCAICRVPHRSRATT
jgi:penicillin-binding protein 2